MIKKEMIAMLLAGGQGSRLGVLTQKVAKPAVSFGGKYRIIDFPLSNCINSGVDTVGVLTQYQPLRLNSHIGIGIPWDLDRNVGGVTILPPYERSKGSDWYTGTANATYVAPVISLKKGDIVKATFDYSIIIKSTAPESTEQYVRLYMADKDMPDAFTTLVASGDDNSGDRATASGSITVPADGLYYFGYMVESPVSTQAFNLYSTKIEKTGNDPNVGVQNVETEDNGYYISGRTLCLIGDYQIIRIYNGNGQLILNTGNTSKIELDSYEKGIYILSLTSRLATKTSKFLVK